MLTYASLLKSSTFVDLENMFSYHIPRTVPSWDRYMFFSDAALPKYISHNISPESSHLKCQERIQGSSVNVHKMFLYPLAVCWSSVYGVQSLPPVIGLLTL